MVLPQYLYGILVLMKSVKTAGSLVLVIVLCAIAAGLYGYVMQGRVVQKSIPSVTNFTECAAAGYPVMESYPRQCQGPDGRSFVEDVTMPIDISSATSTATSTATTTDKVPTNVEMQ